MKSSPVLAIFLTVTALGLSLPVRADQSTSESVQTTIITGSNNSVTQYNNTNIRSGTRGNTNSGTSVRNRQTADVAGNNNTVDQSNQTQVDRHQQNSR